MAKPLFESMTRLNVGRFVVRVWKAELHLDAAADPDRKSLFTVESDLNRWMSQKPVPPKHIVEEFACLPNVTAVEVLAPDGNGIVKYNDWP